VTKKEEVGGGDKKERGEKKKQGKGQLKSPEPGRLALRSGNYGKGGGEAILCHGGILQTKQNRLIYSTERNSSPVQP